MCISLAYKKMKSILLDKTIQEKRELFEQCHQQNVQVSEVSKQIISNTITFHPCNIFLGPNVLNDIELFSTFNNTKDSQAVFDAMDFHSTEGGKFITKCILEAPSCDKELLEKRVTVLNSLENHSSKIVDDVGLDILKHHEKDIAWLLSEPEEHIKELLDIIFFRAFFLKKLNNIPAALTFYNLYRIVFSPLLGFITPILYVIVPFFVLTFKFKIKVSLSWFLKYFLKGIFSSSSLLFPKTHMMQYASMVSVIFSILFYFQGMLNSVEISKTIYKLCDHVLGKYNGVVKYLHTSLDLIQKYWTNDILVAFTKTARVMDGISEESYISKLVDQKFSIFNNFGKVLHQYKHLQKDILTSLVTKSYLLDVVRSLITFKRSQAFCYTKFMDSSNVPSSIPCVHAIGIRHPCISASKVVRNDIHLGGQDHRTNVILTGPNAGGKSTFIKSMLINTILSQTVSISCCDSCEMTLFQKVNSQINIPDCKGKESLFEAEMHRCAQSLSLLNDTHTNTFIIMDEIFNSTNPVEGISGAYAIAKHMGKCKNAIVIFTTHYVYLTKLGKHTEDFENYKMSVDIDNESGEITFPYKLQKGVSKQYIALELLKKNGFDEDIIQEALSIKQRLSL